MMNLQLGNSTSLVQMCKLYTITILSASISSVCALAESRN